MLTEGDITVSDVPIRVEEMTLDEIINREDQLQNPISP